MLRIIRIDKVVAAPRRYGIAERSRRSVVPDATSGVRS
jgi:hypothetical protein